MNDWWNYKISESLSLPSINNDSVLPLNINFGLYKHNSDFNSIYYFNDFIINNYENQPNITKKQKIIDKITKTLKIKIQPTNEQKKILNSWFAECSTIYNFCVKQFYENESYFNGNFKVDKLKIFKDLYQNNKKPIPYAILTDEVRIFLSNLKSANTNLKNGYLVL